MNKQKLELNEDKYLEIKPIEIIGEPTETQINLIRNELNEKDILDDDDMNKLKEKRLKAGSDKIILGHLFVECIDHIKNNLNKIEEKKDEDNDESKKLINAKKELTRYLNNHDNQDLRNLIEEYNEGENYGAYFTGLKIRDIAREKKDDMDKVISIFFKIFEEED